MFEWAALPGLGGATARALRRASRFTWTYAFSRTQASVFISERPLLAQSGPSVGGNKSARGHSRSSCACASANVGHEATASMKSVSLHEANVRSHLGHLKQSRMTRRFPRDIPDNLLTFLFLRQPASVASPLLRRAVSWLF